MKKSILFVFFVLFSVVLNAQTLDKHSIELKKIIKTDAKGVVRGFDFGTPAATIKAQEDAKLEAETPSALIYKVPINDKEFCEVIYYLDDNKKVMSFGLEFFEKPGATPEEQIVDDFTNYFDDRYGNFKVNEKDDLVWTSKDGTYAVEMSDESSGDMIEVEIEIYKK